jgi:hypothetical protein
VFWKFFTKPVDLKRPGLLEQVQEAVRPLTDTGDFSLKTISYCDCYQDGGSVILSSDDFDIRFVYNLRLSGPIGCSFEVPDVKNIFWNEFFPTMNIPITIQKSRLRTNVSDDRRQAEQPDRHIIELLLDETGFISELHRLCGEILKNLPRIREVLNEENIDETYRLCWLAIQERERLKRLPSSGGKTGTGSRAAEYQRSKRERLWERLKKFLKQ